MSKLLPPLTRTPYPERAPEAQLSLKQKMAVVGLGAAASAGLFVGALKSNEATEQDEQRTQSSLPAPIESKDMDFQRKAVADNGVVPTTEAQPVAQVSHDKQVEVGTTPTSIHIVEPGDTLSGIAQDAKKHGNPEDPREIQDKLVDHDNDCRQAMFMKRALK